MAARIALLLASLIPTSAQTPLVFEVATVKPGDPDSRVSGGSCHGTDTGYGGFLPVSPPPLGRCMFVGMTLRALIQEAYNLRGPNASDQVTGGPAWIASRKFTIEAKAESPTTEANMRLMLRALLRDRFQLRLHTETREMPGFALVIAGDGHKLASVNSSEPNSGFTNEGRGRLRARKASMAQLATVLAMNLSRPVVDETGLEGGYAFSLSWTPGEDEGGKLGAIVARLPPEVQSRIKQADPNGPSIFSALPEQLGLRLESRRVAAEVFVVDSADLPAEN